MARKRYNRSDNGPELVRSSGYGLKRNALLVGGGRRGHPLSIILLETGHPLYGGGHRIELLVRNIRRLVGETGHRIELLVRNILVGETGRRRLDLSVCCENGEKPHGNYQGRGGRPHQDSHHASFARLHAAPPRSESGCNTASHRNNLRGKEFQPIEQPWHVEKDMAGMTVP
jgi:hypothetical protein